jgi:hypothetical protein
VLDGIYTISLLRRIRKYKSWGNVWSLTLREEHRVRAFEIRVLREIFWAKRDDVTGDWRRLHNKELCTLHQILFG